jgi:uncharacterized protein (TIGR02099 family)
LSFVKLALRVVLVTAMVAYFVVAAVLLVTRYYVLPRVDQWRPDIEQALSDAVGTPVKFDAISANWRGLNANLTLSNLRILDEQGVAQLGIPSTEAIVSWRSLLSMQPVFRYIGVADVIVVARRAPDGTIYVGGFDASSDDDDTSFWQSETMRWLLAQGRLNVEDSRLVWVDQQQSSVPLVIEHIDMTVDNSLLGHQIDLRVTLPEALGGEIEAVAHINSIAGSLSRFLINEPDGYIYASVSEFFPQALAPWLKIPDTRGNFATRLWLDIQGGKFTNFSVTLAGRDASLAADDASANGLLLDQFQWRANGPLAMLDANKVLPDLVRTDGSLQRISSSLTVANGQLRLPSTGIEPIEADQITAQVAISRVGAQGVDVRVQDLALASPDGLITARGSWRLDETSAQKAGVLDIEGTLARFHLPRLHRFMPDTVDADARRWLARALGSGLVPRASFQIKGAVDDFPYGGADEPGTFRVNGQVQDVSIDFANEPGDEGLPWPVLTNLIGTLDLINDRIELDVSAGALTLPKGQRVTLSELTAQLVDLQNTPVLTINGQTQAPAQTYLALFDDTALKDIAPAFVREFSGQGSWSMPLSLKVPLGDIEQTTFEGELALNGGEVVYASAPALTNVQGVALLSEKGFVADGLSGNMLGGEVKLSGGINDTLDTIKALGKLSWDEVGKFTQSGLVGRLFKGELTYDVTASVTGDSFDVKVLSDLTGTSIALPAPLGLSAAQSAATEVSFKGKTDGDTPDTWRLSMANRLSLTARSSAKGSTFFNDMQLALGSAKPLSGSGLTAAVQLPSLNLDQWMPVIETLRAEISAPAPGETQALPPLTAAQIQTKQLMRGVNHLDDFTANLTIERGRQYKVRLASAQTNGEVHWALDNGKLQDGFHVRLDRLEIGNRVSDDKTDKQTNQKSDDNAQESPLPKPGQLSDLPTLDVQINDLSLYGSRLGSLKIKGRNAPDNKTWQITQLEVSNPHAALSATGSCRFNQDPGVVLDAQLKIADLGELTQFLGHGNEVRKGRGTLDAKIDWSGFPWRFDYAGLSGRADLKLEEGVFDHVNSSSARVLELLSMQSLNRLLSANLNADESFANGFPWSSITGTFDITKGVVDTQNLAVNSPVATISMQGNSSLVDETWDLSAVVRPNLDMSGTALATGFLVNPIVGLSALVGQYLLRNPVESALSQRFTVGGTWEKPIISGGSDTGNPDKKPPEATPPSGSPDAPTSGGAVEMNNGSKSAGAIQPKGEDQFDTSDLLSGN